MDDRSVNDSIIKLACYEPAGTSVEFSMADLLGHTLAFGATGAGKTTRLIYPMVEQLVRHKAASLSDKVGLVIFDTKGDGDARQFLETACQDANRIDDLVVIDGSGERFLDPLEPIHRKGLEGVDSITSLLAAMVPRDHRNPYWERTWESLLRQALQIINLTSANAGFEETIEFLISYLLGHSFSEDPVSACLAAIDERVQDPMAPDRIALNEIRATHRMWTTLDPRTRSILQSMSSSALGALNSTVARQYFSGSTASDVGEVSSNGKILLVSIDGVRYGSVARLVGTFLKGRFYDSILRRRPGGDQYRLAGLILDDWSLSATGGTGTTYSDVDALALVRSRGGFLMAAAQGISGLDLVLGMTSRRAALANINNVFFFRSRDAELDAMAAAWLGEVKDTVTDRSYSYPRRGDERSWTEIRYEREMRRPAVPLGSLARLLTGEAVAMIGGQVFSQPLCLVPSFGKDTPF